LLANAELDAKIHTGKGQLLALLGIGTKDKARLKEARAEFNYIIESYRQIPAGTGGDERRISLRPWIAQAYNTLSTTILWEVLTTKWTDNWPDQKTGLIEAARLYDEALKLTPSDDAKRTVLGRYWRRFYLDRRGYIACLQGDQANTVNLYTEAQELVDSDRLLDDAIIHQADQRYAELRKEPSSEQECTELDETMFDPKPQQGTLTLSRSGQSSSTTK
jgi:hypothetical protein